MEEPKRLNLAGVAKRALIAFLLLALAVWWCVPHADASQQLAVTHAPPTPPPVRVRHAGLHNHVSEHGPPGRARQRFHSAHSDRSEEIRKANADPNSLYDMSTP
jgi:hypothetical protein